MKPYLILENGKELIIASWEEKMRQLVEMSKTINKAALKQSELINELEKEVNQKICQTVIRQEKLSIEPQSGPANKNTKKII